MEKQRLIDELNPYKIIGEPCHSPTIADTMQGNLSSAWRHGVAMGVLRTTKFFNKKVKPADRVWAHGVMAEVFGDDGWWVGMAVDDGSPQGSK